MIERAILSLAVMLWLTACTLVEPSLTTSPAARPTPSPPLSQPTATAAVIEPTPLRQEPDEEKRIMATAAPTPTPSFPDLPDLTPPPGGWIAFETPEERLALIAPDDSRRVPLIEEGTVESFAWSPDGRWLAFVRGGQLTLLSLEDARFVTLTPPLAIRHWKQVIWSQDSRHLAYLHTLEQGSSPVAPDALRILDISTGKAITVSTYSNTRPSEVAILSPQPFPLPLLGVAKAGFNRTVRIWDVRDRQVLTTIHLPSFRRHYLWLPHTPGLVFAREETEKAGLEWTCLQDTQVCMKGETKVRHLTSVTVWRMNEDSAGDEAPVVVLEGTQQRHYHPVRWLPDGRLEVRVSHFEKTTYEGQPQPERVTYRCLALTDDGMLQEAEASDLPWWAAGGFEEAFKATALYRERNGDPLLIPGWEAGPDGETVAFALLRRTDAEKWASAIYLWRGEGKPRQIAEGSHPNWQPSMSSSGP